MLKSKNVFKRHKKNKGDQMMKKNISVFLTMLLVAGALFSGCQASTAEATATIDANSTGISATETLSAVIATYSEEDLNSSWDASKAVTIVLSDSGIQIDGDGASAEGSTLTIKSAGTYVLSGTLSQGQILVAADAEDTVRIVLNGVAVTNSDNAAIYAEQSEKLILTLAEGTANTFQDGSTYTYANAEDNEPNATIFSKDDLTINGSGTLTVNGNYKHGVASKDDLVITGGILNITAVSDGLKGKDSIAIADGLVTIAAGADGLQTTNGEEEGKGWISLDGGMLNITAGNDGVQAETTLNVTKGEYTITTGGGSANAVNTHQEERPMRSRDAEDTTAQSAPLDVTETTDSSADAAESAKGLKAGTCLQIQNGTFAIDTLDDALNSGNTVLIENGTIDIAAGDDAIHADTALVVNNGDITITKSYEGLESTSITVNDGTIELASSDDGFNGSDGSGSSGFGGGGADMIASESVNVTINGGWIYVNAGGDGLDSNGSMNINGGTVLVSGPTNNGNGPLDYNGSCTVTGGTLAIAGSSGMAQAPGTDSTQNSILVKYTATQTAGTLVTLTDAAGNSIVSFAPAKAYQSIVISSPELKTGETYTLLSGGSNNGTAVNGFYDNGTVTGSTTLTDVTLSSVATGISDDGSVVSTEGHGPGGKRPGSERNDTSTKPTIQ